MKTTLSTLLRGTAIAAAMFTTLASHAAEGDAAHARYLRGETAAATQNAAISTRQVPGAYASYLIHNGTPVAQALAQAQASGESPTYVAERTAAPTKLSSYQVYQRELGISPAL